MFNQGKAYLTGACPARPVALEDGTGVKLADHLTGVCLPVPLNVYPVKRGAMFNQGEAYLTGVPRASLGAGGE